MKKIRLLILVLAVTGALALPFMTSARSSSSVNITIVNNSNREIIHIYLSHVDQDDWGGNQLGETTIGPGQTQTLSGVSWDNTQVKLNAEDRDGCFLSHVSPGSGSDSWTVTNTDPANCSGN
jgi:hypothetical protein